MAHRQEGETFRQYVLRHKVEIFRALTADLAKPAELFPEIYQDWGDERPSRCNSAAANAPREAHASF